MRETCRGSRLRPGFVFVVRIEQPVQPSEFALESHLGRLVRRLGTFTLTLRCSCPLALALRGRHRLTAVLLGPVPLGLCRLGSPLSSIGALTLKLPGVRAVPGPSGRLVTFLRRDVSGLLQPGGLLLRRRAGRLGLEGLLAGGPGIRSCLLARGRGRIPVRLCPFAG